MAVYFSGFGLHNESELFFAPDSAVRDCLQMHAFDVVGFSYGAQKAVRYALGATHPIRRLSLLSPAFFDFLPKRKEQELRLFAKNPARYMQTFVQNALSTETPATQQQIDRVLPYFAPSLPPSKELANDLHALLFYEFQANELREIMQSGIEIEVFLGEKDRIIAASKARDFFAPLVTRVFWVRNAGHFLML